MESIQIVSLTLFHSVVVKLYSLLLLPMEPLGAVIVHEEEGYEMHDLCSCDATTGTMEGGFYDHGSRARTGVAIRCSYFLKVCQWTALSFCFC